MMAMPGLFLQQQAFVVQVQSGLHQMSGAVVNLQVDEAFELVVGTRF